MKFTPLQDWAVIRPSAAAEMTAGGIFIPDTAKEKPREGTVESIGPGALEEQKFGKKEIEEKDRKFIPTTIKPRDRVLYEQYADRAYKIGNEELVLVRERDILGILPAKQEQKQEKPKPLQIPAFTTPQSSTIITRRPFFPIIATPETAVVRKPAKQAKKKAAAKAPSKKKAAKKAVKKSAKKALKPAPKRPKTGSSSSKKARKKK